MNILSNNGFSKNKVTIVTCIHGNEYFGKVVYDYFKEKLSEFPGLTIVLANVQAMKLRKRYVEADLNRSFPGKEDGNSEQRLAKNIMKAIDSDSLILDIHSTRSKISMVPIITNLSVRTKKILNQFPETNIVFMKGGYGSLISQYKGSVSLEYNVDFANDPKNIRQLDSIVRALLRGTARNKKHHMVYECIGKIPLKAKIPTKAENFKLIDGTNIIPFLPRRSAFKGSKGFCLNNPKKLIS